VTLPQGVGETSLASQGDYLLLLARWQIPLMLCGRLDPADLVQETLLRAHRNWSQFRGDTTAQLRGWLRKILQNVLIESIREALGRQGEKAVPIPLQRLVEESSLRLERLLEANESTPSQKLMREEQLARLARALRQLPEDQRQAVQFHHLDGQSLTEVGKLLGRSKEAVAGLLFRGLRKLRDALQDPPERTP
jgi:RNA polymerase sigma-70 factor (ECF subfamily)